MKKLTLIMIIATAFLGSISSDKGTWVVESNSRLVIFGSTNVNKFTCKIDYYSGTDTLRFVRNHKTGQLLFANNAMTIPVQNFDCGTKQISTDFQKTLKAETYPQLSIKFKSLQNPFSGNNSRVKGIVEITLAGVTTTYTVDYRATFHGDTILLHGTHPVNFSDFNLEAPKKLQGLIKVREVLNVQFNLVMKQV